MSKPVRKNHVTLNWKKYERKTSVRLAAAPKKKKIKQSRKNNQLTLGIAALCFLIAIILIGKLFGFLGGINPQSLKNIQPKLNTWDGQSDLNLVVKMDTPYLLSYQPSSKELTIIKFPSDIYMDVPFNFGKWPMRSIYDLGQAEKPPMGATLLRDSINHSFDILADGYIIFNDNDKNLPDLINDERGSLLPGTDILSKVKTDLKLTEFFKIWWAIKEVRSDKIKIINLEKSELTSWLLLPDGSRVIALDEIKLDKFEQDNFENKDIKKEGLSIGIFNATDFPGLAEKAARVLTNMGGKVIFTQNAPDKVNKSTILAKQSYTTKYFSKMLNLYCPQPTQVSLWKKIPLFGLNQNGDCTSDTTSLDTSRADIIIILGEDTFLKYQKI